MSSTTIKGTTPNRGWRAVALLAIAAGWTGCGDSEAARRDAVREEAARQFARPTDAADQTLAAGVETGADGPDAATPEATAPDAGRPEASAPGTAGPPDPDAIMAGADAAYSGLSSLRASFVQRVDIPLLDRTSQGHGTWYQEGRDRFRMDFDDPPDNAFVGDGEFLWLYEPSANPDQVIKVTLAEGGQSAGGADVLGRILSEARVSYDAIYEGTAIVSERRTHVISLMPRGPSEYRLVRVWVSTDDRLVRRFRIEQENEMIRTVTLARLEPNVPLEDDLFRFVVPEGVLVYEP